MSKKSDNEKKSITKSFKISPDIAEKINSDARKKGMNFSQYMIDCAVHKDNALTPEILCRIENILEMYADNKSDTQKFVDFLKSVTKDYHWKVIYGVNDRD